MDFRQRLEQGRLRLAGDDTASEMGTDGVCPYFSTDKTKSPACLDLRLSCGNHIALPYSYFTEMIFNTETGIEIHTADKKINIVGRNLIQLFDHLIAYRVKFIQANIGGDLNEDGLFVKEIMIENTGL